MWVELQSGETASALYDRLEGLGAVITTNKGSGASLIYSANGLVLRQVEEVTVNECRALTEDAASKLMELKNDSTTKTIYYKRIGSSSEYAAVGVTTGNRRGVAVSRVDDSGNYRATVTDTVYSAGSATGWSTTRPAAAASTGIVVGSSSSSSYMWSYNGNNVYSTETTTTTEYRYLTEEEARTKVNQNRSNNTSLKRYRYGTSTAYVYAMTGTIKTASMHYVDADHGYTVTVNEKVVGATGTNWSQA